jgi:hypothetical protein
VSDWESLTVRCPGSPSLRTRWYRSLAHALAATASPCGALFEATSMDPVPRVTVRPSSLIETVRASPSLRSLSLERFATAPSHEPPEGGASELRLVIPRYQVVSAPRGTGIHGDAPETEWLRGDSGWVGFQTAWWRGPTGELRVARRYRFRAGNIDELERRGPAVATAVAEEWAEATGVPATCAPAPSGTLTDWRRGTLRKFPEEAWLVRRLEEIESTAESRAMVGPPTAADPDRHRIVFGSSGAGKTTFLAREAARQVELGRGLLAIDLHGDLAPAIAGRLGPIALGRTVAVDASRPPVPGIAALAAAPDSEDRTAAHLVAALKRLSPDGTELHWGFRLERIFDSFVRLVQESGGSLVDLFGLLTDPSRREAARLSTRRPDLAGFLAELEVVLRRQPDFLWSAATRLSKVVLVPALRELLAPRDGGLPLEDLVAEGRTVLVRLPFALLGPEAATFAGTLLLTRAYLGLAARREGSTGARPVFLVLDEVHGFSPRLVAEILTESRKFGIRALIATQYPDRLTPEVRSAAAGVLTDVLAFRVPHRSARAVGEWVGLTGDEAERRLPVLPAGHGVRWDPDLGIPRLVVPPATDPIGNDEPAWSVVRRRSQQEFAISSEPIGRASDDEEVLDHLLLAVLAREEGGNGLRTMEAISASGDVPETVRDPVLRESQWARIVRQGYVEETDAGYRLTAAGERRLGLTRPTGATRETAEHRLLLVATFRIFARRGYRIEILRQGRFDTTLPDAVFRQLPDPRRLIPAELEAAVERARPGWAWRFFGGRDVHIEAEVSGALRPERVRHGWQKALARGAFALFVVGDAGRARRVRATLRAIPVGPDRAQVWTLSRAVRAEVRRSGGNE